MAIRFNKEYNAEIRRTVSNFNRKRNRAIKRGFKYLPPLLTTTELKSRYETKGELDRELTRLRNFNKQKDNALKVVETSGGAKAIKWEIAHLKANLRYAKEYYDREIKRMAKISDSNQILRNENINNLKTKRDYLDLEIAELTPSQLKTFTKTVNEALQSNFNKARSYRNFMKEVDVIMRILGYDNKTINRFFEGFEELTPDQFLNLYQESSLVSRIYELYIPTTTGVFRLSTSEDDAKNLINTFMLEKNDLISKAKKGDFTDKRTNQEILNAINEVKLKEQRDKANKIARKDLTPEQIKQLEELGWDDIIE